MSLEKQLGEIQVMMDQGLYLHAGLGIAAAIEQVFRTLIRNNLLLLADKDRMLFQEKEREIGKGKGFNDFGLGQLCGVVRESDFFKAWASATGKELRGVRFFNWSQVVDLRNELAHAGATATKSDAELLLHCLNTLLETFGILVVDTATKGEPPVTPRSLTDVSLDKYTRRVRQFLENDGIIDANEREILRMAAEDLGIDSVAAAQAEARVVEAAQRTAGEVFVLDVASFGDTPPRTLLALVARNGGVYRPENRAVEFQTASKLRSALDLMITEGLALAPERQKALVDELVKSLLSAGRWMNKAEVFENVSMSQSEWDVLRREARHAGAIVSTGPSFKMRYGLPGWPPPNGDEPKREAPKTAAPKAETPRSASPPPTPPEPAWTPGPGIGSFTLSQIERNRLQPFLRELLGHGDLRKINRALGQHHGKTLVQTVFPELERSKERAMLAEMTITRAKELQVFPVLERILCMSSDEIALAIDRHGRTSLKTAFPQLVTA